MDVVGDKTPYGDETVSMGSRLLKAEEEATVSSEGTVADEEEEATAVGGAAGVVPSGFARA